MRLDLEISYMNRGDGHERRARLRLCAARAVCGIHRASYCLTKKAQRDKCECEWVLARRRRGQSVGK